jgi:hypothetical protein
MKKKHKTGYRTGNDVKTPFPLPIKKPFPNGKPPILWVKKNGKVVKATEEEIQLAKSKKTRWIKGRPSTVMIGTTKIKKGGKV